MVPIAPARSHDSHRYTDVCRISNATVTGLLAAWLLCWTCSPVAGENWPRWRGPGGNGVSSETGLPLKWSRSQGILWSVPLKGEGASQPVVWDNRIYLTSAHADGTRRTVSCRSFKSGRELWSRTITDDDPELSSALTGHAAATPVTDGRHVFAWFGNAGCLCLSAGDGAVVWRKGLGTFETELGLASSPVIVNDSVVLLCDHDGTAFQSFDSFVVRLRKHTGKTVWRTPRPKLYRSWSTPVIVPVDSKRMELVVSAQDEVRGYDPETGKQLWSVTGTTGWVTPSPVVAGGLIYVTSGKNGPTLAIRPGGRGDVTESHVVWRRERRGPYVCSPLVYRGQLYLLSESGVVRCLDAETGTARFEKRLPGKFTASPVAGDGRVYMTNQDGTTYVLRAGGTFTELARNRLEEFTIASPAIARQHLLLRTEQRLYCVRKIP